MALDLFHDKPAVFVNALGDRLPVCVGEHVVGAFGQCFRGLLGTLHDLCQLLALRQRRFAGVVVQAVGVNLGGLGLSFGCFLDDLAGRLDGLTGFVGLLLC